MGDICALTENYAYMSKDLRHLIVTEYLPCAYSYFCHTPRLSLVAVLSIGCDAAQRHGGMYTGVICDLGWSLVNMVLLHWSCQSAGQPVSFRKRLGESEDAHWEQEPDWTAVRQVFPAVNLNPQNRSNDAGSLKRPAGWKWVKEDLMSPSLHWSRFLSISINDMMTSKTATELCGVLRDDHITGVNKTSISGTLWKVLIPD